MNAKVVLVIVKAFNFFVEGKAVKQLLWKPAIESFPEVLAP